MSGRCRLASILQIGESLGGTGHNIDPADLLRHISYHPHDLDEVFYREFLLGPLVFSVLKPCLRARRWSAVMTF
jgi:hypothetical protein